MTFCTKQFHFTELLMSLSDGTIRGLCQQAETDSGVSSTNQKARRDQNLKVMEAYGKKCSTFVTVRFIYSDINSSVVCNTFIVFCLGVFEQSIIYSLKCLWFPRVSQTLAQPITCLKVCSESALFISPYPSFAVCHLLFSCFKSLCSNQGGERAPCVSVISHSHE